MFSDIVTEMTNFFSNISVYDQKMTRKMTQKQGDGKLIVVPLFVFDLEVRWGTSNNGWH